MADAKFTATITATDETTATLREIGRNVGSLSAGMKKVGAEEHRIGSPGVWSRLTGFVHGSEHAVGHLTGSIGELHSRISELIPPLAALGSVAAVGGIFELTEHVAEAQAKFQHLARNIGFENNPTMLAQLQFRAKLTDTDPDAIARAMGRLNAGVGAAAMGANKNLAALFGHLGIHLRDTQGHIREIADIVPEVFKAFRVNTNSEVRGQIGRALFGIGGKELIDMLTLSREETDRLNATFARLRFPITAEGKKGLIEYHETWLELGFAVNQLTKSVFTQVAPVLTPIVAKFTEWTVVNREWIGQGLAQLIRDLGDELDRLDVKRLVDDMEHFAPRVEHVANSVTHLAEEWLIFKGVLKVFSGLEWAAGLIGGYRAIATAAKAAMGAELGLGAAAAAAAGPAADAAARVAAFRLGLRVAGPAGAVLYEMWPTPANAGENKVLEDSRAAAEAQRRDDDLEGHREGLPRDWLKNPNPTLYPAQPQEQPWRLPEFDREIGTHPLPLTGRGFLTSIFGLESLGFGASAASSAPPPDPIPVELKLTLTLPDGFNLQVDPTGNSTPITIDITHAPTGRAFPQAWEHGDH